jgi:hypothetical protein
VRVVVVNQEEADKLPPGSYNCQIEDCFFWDKDEIVVRLRVNPDQEDPGLFTFTPPGKVEPSSDH